MSATTPAFAIEARGVRKAFGKNARQPRPARRRRPHRRPDRPERRRQDHRSKAILGLSYEGELRVLGRNPYLERNAVMQEVCFIADVAVLPPWLKVSQALDFVGGVHPRFDRAKAEAFLAKTNIPRDSRVHKLSKGMITQLHLALVMAIDARLLVLDEPTLGLDILYRKAFYDTLLNDYFDHSRTILVTTHQVEEIQHVLTDVMFINKGRLVLDCSMEDFESRYVEVMVRLEQTGAAARALKPMHERQVFGRSVFLFDAPIATRSPRSARRAPPALQTCSSR